MRENRFQTVQDYLDFIEADIEHLMKIQIFPAGFKAGQLDMSDKRILLLYQTDGVWVPTVLTQAVLNFAPIRNSAVTIE
jgi:hypothetical protein